MLRAAHAYKKAPRRALHINLQVSWRSNLKPAVFCLVHQISWRAPLSNCCVSRRCEPKQPGLCLGHLTAYCSASRFCVACIHSANTDCRAGSAVFAPLIGCLPVVPIVVCRCATHRYANGDFERNIVRIGDFLRQGYSAFHLECLHFCGLVRFQKYKITLSIIILILYSPHPFFQ